MDLEIKTIYNLKQEKEKIEEQIGKYQSLIDELKTKIKDIDANITSNSKILCESMKNNNLDEYKIDNLVATFFKKTTQMYLDEAKVINVIESMALNNLIKKTLNKRELTKELKTNDALRTQLIPLTVDSLTEYVVVTTDEKTERMKQHILENTSSK